MRHFLLTLLIVAFCGCKTTEPQPEAEAKKVSGKGQVIWKRHSQAEELVTDLEVEVTPDGTIKIQVVKGPVVILSGHTSKNDWSVEMAMEKRKYAGKGAPPPQLSWLHLARVFGGYPALAGWNWKIAPDRSWSFVHRGTGESFEGFLE